MEPSDHDDSPTRSKLGHRVSKWIRKLPLGPAMSSHASFEPLASKSPPNSGNAATTVGSEVEAETAGEDSSAAKSKPLCIRRFGSLRLTTEGDGNRNATSLPLHDFVWKPSSDVDGKLVVLLGAPFDRQVASVRVRAEPDGESWSGHCVGRDAERQAHFRFPGSGRRLPPNCALEVVLADGRILRRTIANPELRLEVGPCVPPHSRTARGHEPS